MRGRRPSPGPQRIVPARTGGTADCRVTCRSSPVEIVHRLGHWPALPHSRRGFARLRYGNGGIALALCSPGRRRTSGTVLTWLDPRRLPCHRAGDWCAREPEHSWDECAVPLRRCLRRAARGSAGRGGNVTTLREETGPGAEEGGPDQAVTGLAAVPAWRRWPPALTRLVRRHWIFTSALAVAVLPRLVAMLGFQPGVLFQLDTYDYLWGAVHVSPNVVNPSGYSLFLWLLRPFHSLMLVAFLQHLLGLGIATMVYALVRRYGLPAWGATLAAAPVLFDPAQILVEQFVMADLLAMALMVGAFTVLLLPRSPSMWQVIAAGLMTGASVTVRPTALPLILLVPLFLLLRRAGWRRA